VGTGRADAYFEDFEYAEKHSAIPWLLQRLLWRNLADFYKTETVKATYS